MEEQFPAQSAQPHILRTDGKRKLHSENDSRPGALVEFRCPRTAGQEPNEGRWLFQFRRS